MADPLDIKLKPVVEVIKSSQSSGFEMAEPIKLFPDDPAESASSSAAPAATPKPAQAPAPTAAKIAPQVEPAPVVAAPAPQAAPAAIEIAISSDPTIEPGTKPAITPTSAAAPAMPSQPGVPGSSLDISITNTPQIDSTSAPLEVSLSVGSVSQPAPAPTSTRSLFSKKVAPATAHALAAPEGGTKSLFSRKLTQAPAEPVPGPAFAPLIEAPRMPPPESFGGPANAIPFQHLAVQPVAAMDQAVSEKEAAKDLPYLFKNSAEEISAPKIQINTGGPISNDIETLKEYLTMREQDVSVLTVQLTYAKEKLAKFEETIRQMELKAEDLQHQVEYEKKRNGELEVNVKNAGQTQEAEINDLKQDLKSKIERIKLMETRLHESNQQYESLKNRVRVDIRKIRVREKELESKLEILKRDSETLVAARENKILELKRKADLFEFNYEMLQDQNNTEKANTKALEDKLEQIMKILKIAMGIIEAHEPTQKTERQVS